MVGAEIFFEILVGGGLKKFGNLWSKPTIAPTVFKRIRCSLDMHKVSAMDPIATYVFIDLGADGLRQDEPDKVISMNLLAVRSKDLRNITNETREENIANPPIYRENHYHLVDEHFDPENEIINFLKPLDEPLCLIAFSAFNYDFPLLKRMLSPRGESFFENIVCADSMGAFFDILHPQGVKSTRAERLAGCFPWDTSYFDKPSFALRAVYGRELENTEYYANGGYNYQKTPEFRNKAALRVAVKISQDFVTWLEQEENCFRFSEVPVRNENNPEETKDVQTASMVEDRTTD